MPVRHRWPLAVPVIPPRARVDVWSVSTAWPGKARPPVVVTPEERDFAEGLSATVSDRWLLRRTVVRLLLAEICQLDARELVILRGTGRPQVAEVDVRYSVSHTDGLTLLAVASDDAVGIDVERVREIPRAAEIANRYFDASDARTVRSAAASDRARTFLELWTRREALVKASGEGLTAIRQATIDGEDGSTGTGQRWRLRGLDPAEGYVAALTTTPGTREVRCARWVIPA